MTSFEDAVLSWLARPYQVQDWSDVDQAKLRSRDVNVVAAEYSKVKIVDGSPHYTVPDGWEIESVAVEHEEGWFNDHTGTGWPASVTVVVTRTKTGPKGQKHRRKDTVHASSDPLEFMQELFRD